ncbi:MAG: WXG100 family type VII secretion target [Bifidobacteriaceae bacterium]|jgi:uncharacterized protein YukE|nr:WXG100 family type VII secretion target [Bifidobacteriaceae bacterium]
MANAYGYTPAEMTAAGQRLISIKGSIGEQIVAAQNVVSGLIGSGFATQAASGAYQEQFTSLAEGLRSVSDNLEPLGSFLVQYADSVVDMDTQFGSQLRGS